MKYKLLSAVLLAVVVLSFATLPLEARSRTNVSLNVGAFCPPPCYPVYEGYAVEYYNPYYAVPVYPRTVVYQAPQPYYRPVVVYPQRAPAPVFGGFSFFYGARR